MDSNKQPVDQFKEYAENELKNHQSELKTKYENESVGSETLKNAYADHKTIYSKELDQKIKDLSKDDASHEAKLEALKKEYVDKLTSERL
jgi:hypothetical protein